MASKKGFLSVPGFYAHKKAGKLGQNQIGAQHQNQSPPTSMMCEPVPNLPPKIQKQNMSLVSDNSAEVTAPNSVSPEPSLLVPPLKPIQPITFDQLITEIDRDIQCFDRVATEQLVPNDTQPELITSQHDGPNISKVPPPKNKPVEPTKATPLSDITNSTQAYVTIESASEKRWLRIQRPNLMSNDELLKTSLGKRGP
nr:hypothetical protein CFP56_45718 [Quercus suber]